MEKNKWALSNIKLPLVWHSFGITAIGKKLYLSGGATPSTSYTNIHYVFDSLTETWEQKTAMPVGGKIGVTSVSCNGKIYTLGGMDLKPLLTTELLEYDPQKDTWEKKLDFPGRSVVAMCVADEKIYICGGVSGLEGWQGTTFANTLHVYDPQNNSLEEKTNMLRNVVGILCHYRGQLYCFGRTTDGLFHTQRYDIKSNAWSMEASIPDISGIMQSGAQCGESAYIIAGGKTYRFSFQNKAWNEVCTNEFGNNFIPVICGVMENRIIEGSGLSNPNGIDLYELTPDDPMRLHILLEETEKINLTATLVPQDVKPDDLEWSSDGIEISTVDQDGVVTAEAPGSAEITVRSPGSDFKASAKVLVIAKGESGLRLSILIKAEEKCRLVTAYNGEIGKAAWKSSDESRVLVDNAGRVTAVAPGLALVTAISEGSENTDQIYVSVSA